MTFYLDAKNVVDRECWLAHQMLKKDAVIFRNRLPGRSF
jgi:hypothetical protein